MQSPKTHRQELDTIQRRSDLHRPQEPGADVEKRPAHAEARQSDMPVSRGGMNQESRQHNKPADPAPAGAARKH